MTTLLQINTSIFVGNGQSTRLANAFVERWRTTHPETRTLVRDLGRDPAPHLTAERFAALMTPPEERTPEQAAVVSYSDALIQEWRESDVVVLGLPMYNYGVPSSLKAYFDHLARAGVTFRYTEQGPAGLLADRPVYVFAARGGAYLGTGLDTQSDYVRNFLGLLGIRSVEFIYAEGLNMGETSKAAAIAQAEQRIGEVLAHAAVA